MTRQLMIVTLGMAALLATGCTPGMYAGGGWLPSADPEATRPQDRATLSVFLKAEDTSGDGNADTIKGQIQYDDRGADVRIHGVVDDEGGRFALFVPADCDECFVFSHAVGIATGTYEPQPRSLGEGGTFEVVVAPFDANSGFPAEVQIELFGGVYDGYFNRQFLENGMFTLLPLGNN